MHIAMIGSGYVGLVSGACFADFGHTVICIDNNEGKIEALNAGKTPIFEPGLQDLVGTNVHQRRLSFSTDLKEAVASSSPEVREAIDRLYSCVARLEVSEAELEELRRDL